MTWSAKHRLTSVRLCFGVAALMSSLSAIDAIQAQAPVITNPTDLDFLATNEVFVGGTWTSRTRMPTPRDDFSISGVNGIILVAGGQIFNNCAPIDTLEAYDPASDSWTTKTAMPTPRWFAGAATVGGIMYVIGGQPGCGGDLDTVEAYDAGNDSWSSRAAMPTSRLGIGVGVVDGIIYAIGGAQNSDNIHNVPVSTVEAYNPMTNTWTAKAPMSTVRSRPVVGVVNRKIYVIGGFDPFGLTTVEEYDTDTNTWTPKTSMPVMQPGSAGGVLNNLIYVVGGSDTTVPVEAAASRVQTYNPATDTWSTAADMPTPRIDLGATVANGKLYAVGGNLDGTGRVDQPFTYQITATNHPASYSASGLPPGLSFDTSLGLIYGTPTDPSDTFVQFAATNAAGTGSASLRLVILPAFPSGPHIVSSTCATGRTGNAFSFQLQTSGGSSATHFTVGGLPPGLILDPSTGFISGIPTLDGNFGLAVTAIDGTAITHATLQFTFISDSAVPIITSAASAILTPGQFLSYAITADAGGIFGYIGTDGVAYQGPSPSCAGLPAGLCFDGDHTISGTFVGGPINRVKKETPDGVAGGIVTNVQLFATDPSGTGTFPLITFIAAPGTVNISTRLSVGTDNNVLIGGFIIQGTGTTRALIRALGPSLTDFGVPNALANPTLELRDGAGSLLGSNDNWRDSQSYAIGNTGIPPTDDLESAILAFLSPGSYTAVVSGKNNTTGVALVEVYDLGIAALLPPGDARLANISTRGFADTGDNVIIGGFIVRPQAPATSTRVVVRAIGPSLPVSGQLEDPSLELKDGNGVTIISNDDWQQGPQADTEEIQKLGLAPNDIHESALIKTLATGPYTAIAFGANNTTGVALVEVYSLP